MLLWHHGTLEKNWTDSGWVLDGIFYPVEYSDDKNGPDKVLGRELLRKDVETHPDKYHPNVRKEMGVRDA